jgi:hypothetical protein
MTLSAYVALIVVGGHDGRLFPGAVVTLALDLLVGSINATLVLVARIPAIIATLAAGNVLAAAPLLANRARRPVAVAAKQRRGLPHRYSAGASFAPLVTAYLGKSTVPGQRAPLERKTGSPWTTRPSIFATDPANSDDPRMACAACAKSRRLLGRECTISHMALTSHGWPEGNNMLA